jgi:hypothetical protein
MTTNYRPHYNPNLHHQEPHEQAERHDMRAERRHLRRRIFLGICRCSLLRTANKAILSRGASVSHHTNIDTSSLVAGVNHDTVSPGRFCTQRVSVAMLLIGYEMTE